MARNLRSDWDSWVSGDGPSMARYDCPFCGGEGTFSVRYLVGRFRCFRASCGQSGSLEHLSRRLQLAPMESTPSPSASRSLSEVVRSVSLDRLRVQPIAPQAITFPPGVDPIREGGLGWNYLVNRGVSELDIIHSEIHEGRWKGAWRVFIPVFGLNGDLVYFSARKVDSGNATRYANPTVPKANLIFRVWDLDVANPVVICEGMISAIVAGNAVATLGVLYSRSQVESILSLGASSYLVAFDGDEVARSEQLALDLAARGRDARVVVMPPGHDPASLGRETFRRMAMCSLPVGYDTTHVLRERLRRIG